jgi:alcohol dehydrogenase
VRAIAIQAHGGLEQVKLRTDWPDPVPAAGEAVVDVKACGLNYLDVFVLRGMPGLPVEMPRIPGGDISGVVGAVGAGVPREWIGRRVLIDPHIKTGGALGENANGGLCEKIAVPAENLIHLPEAVTFEQAASLPIAYGTAYRMLITRGQVQPGELVLILGASGGVGTGCVQIAKNLKARVIACASSASKLRRLQELGADHVIDYTKEDFTQGRQRFDVILDNVLNHPPKATARVLAPDGVLIPNSLGYTGGLFAGLPRMARAVLMGRLGSTTVKLVSPAVNRENLDALLRLLESGEVRVVIDKTYPLDQAAGAVTHMLEHHPSGKIAITA